jgi:RecA/RadA recombinase
MKYGVTSDNTGTVIYIDTEGSFVPIRLQNMALAGDNHYKNVDKNLLNTNSVEQILKNVTYFRCINIAELIACLIQIKQLLTSERNVKLIILDSLAHPIRSIVDGDHLTRYKYTVRIVTLLQKLASDYKCAVGLVLLFEIISIRFLRLLLLII